MSAMATENKRLELAWFVKGHNPVTEFNVNYLDATIDNLVYSAERWPIKFEFNGLVGWIDEWDYVTWGGMGVHLVSIGEGTLRDRIRLVAGR